MPIMFTLDVQIRDVIMGEHANFICCAGGTNITTVYWEIYGAREREITILTAMIQPSAQQGLLQSTQSVLLLRLTPL